MNKYELAVVVSAKIEDDERAATLEKVKDIVTKHGGNITNVDEPLEMNACLPGCVWNATPRSRSPMERNIGFWTQA